jgi:hypothetical protein
MRKADLSELDMIGRELYARRMQELTLFGAMSDEQAHDWAMRYALGKSAPPAPPEHLHYPDDYPLPPPAAGF